MITVNPPTIAGAGFYSITVTANCTKPLGTAVIKPSYPIAQLTNTAGNLIFGTNPQLMVTDGTATGFTAQWFSQDGNAANYQVSAKVNWVFYAETGEESASIP